MKIAKFEFSLFGINTYVVYDPVTRDCVIIDPGMFDSDEEEALENFIDRYDLKVTNIIDTHLHIDHAIGVEYAKKKYNVPFLAHKDDEFLGTRLRQQAMQFGLNNKVDDISIDTYLEAGDVIKVGTGELKVIHVPGHSPGSIALYDEKDGFVITGDALFSNSIGRTDLPGGDMRTLVEAIKKGLFTLPDSTVVYPGHGPATTIGREKNTNPYLM
ncbi:MAG: MBL fold metallo-hydrolase [Muribaculaceae bacterium]|nr:MBL fold metallo-hydrolase [Muribaculaceae bacterium]